MFPLGRSAEVSLTVAAADTAVAWRSGDVDVLATPRLIALCEEATVAVLAGRLEPETTTVGFRVQLDHLRPATVGTSISATAMLDKVEGRRLSFTVTVHDDRGPIAAGRITRVVIDRTAFAARC
jgi:fluoroacetyl-CoA thioesterase